MKVTPLEMRQQQFRVVMRGYDRDEVRTFLTEAAEELEQARREIDRLRQEVSRADTALAEFRERETNLRNTLLTAQRLADQIRENAEQEAKVLLREAEGRAELLIQKAQARADEIDRTIHELRLRRRDVEGSLESSIVTLSNALEFIREQDREERQEAAGLARPRSVEPARAAGQTPPGTGPQPASTFGPTRHSPDEEDVLAQLRRLEQEQDRSAPRSAPASGRQG